MLMSFHDLSEEPFKHYCDFGTVERHHRAEWEKGDDLRNELRELLNLALRQKARAYPLLYHSMKEVPSTLPPQQAGEPAGCSVEGCVLTPNGRCAGHVTPKRTLDGYCITDIRRCSGSFTF